MNLIFVSGNQNKYNELHPVFEEKGIQLVRKKIAIEELQISDEEKLVRDKLIKAFGRVKRPVLVEHTFLYLDAFNGIPGSTTQSFYAQMKQELICDYCKKAGNYGALAKTVLGYCDGKKIHIVKKEIKGKIKSDNSDLCAKDIFDWDVIFIPISDKNLEEKTCAELGDKKSDVFVRKAAAEEIAEIIQKEAKETDDNEKKLLQVAELIKKKKIMLFIGAGISNSVDLPTWNTLIRELGKKLGYDEEIYEKYGDYLLLAENYWQQQDDKAKCMEWMKKQLQPAEKERLLKEPIFDLIMQLDVPVIYTTNFDHCIEDYYAMKGKEIQKIVKMDDMVSDKDNLPRIVKFHGDIDDESSIVLTESQYFERMNFDSFLDIMLQADLMKYQVLFLGYSLSDINIKMLLYRSHSRWKNTKVKGRESYIFTATPNAVQRNVFEKHGIVTICNEESDKKKGTELFLRQLVEYAK